MNEVVKKQDQPLETVAPISTPAKLLEMAVDKDLDIDKLQKLMEMQQQWEAKEARTAFFDSLANFQAMCPEIKKTKQGHNSKYAPLSEIAKTISEPLLDNGLSYRWEQSNEGPGLTVTCIVSHRDGHTERTSLTGEPDNSGSKNSIQATGSTVTYLQRYTLICALGLTSADEDTGGDQPNETIDEHQEANLCALIEETKTDRARFLKYFKIKELSGLPDSEYRRAVKQLEAKRKQ